MNSNFNKRNVVFGSLVASTLIFSVLSIISGVAFADNVVTGTSAISFVLPNTGTALWKLVATNANQPGGDQVNGCNASVSNPVIVTIITPLGITANPSSLTFTSCGSTYQPSTISATSPGTYTLTVSATNRDPNLIPGAAYQVTPGTVTATVTGDTTPPIITRTITGTQGLDGWYKNGDVTVVWTVTDLESTPTVSGCGTQVVSASTTPAGVDLLCSATSAGGTTIDNVNIKLDKEAPTTTASASGTSGLNGWYTSDVDVTLNAIDPNPGSGVASITYTLDTNLPVTVSGSSTVVQITGDGTHTLTYFATDVAGDPVETPTAPLEVKIDTTPPFFTFVPPDADFAALGTTGAAPVTFLPPTINDLTSGPNLASIAVDPPSGTSLLVGRHDHSVTGSDNAGLQAVASFTTSVFDISPDTPSPWGVETARYLTIIDARANTDGTTQTVSFGAKTEKGDSNAQSGISVVATEISPSSSTFRNALNSLFITQNPTTLTNLNVGGSGYDTATFSYTSVLGTTKEIFVKTEIPGGAGASATATDPFVWSSDTFQIDSSGTPKLFDSACAANGVVDTRTVQVFSSADTTLRDLTLTEDNANACTFRSTPAIVFSTANSNFVVSPKILKVADLGSVTARYGGNPDQIANIIVNAALSGAVTVYTTNNNCGAGNDVDNDGLCATSTLSPAFSDSTVRSTNWEINSGLVASRGLKILRSDSSVQYVYGCRPLIDDTSYGANPQPAPYNTSVCPNPLKKDIYIEIDYMVGHKPSRDVLAAVILAFANSPVTNPDGSTGITLHIQVDENLGFHYDSISFAPAAGTDFYDIKSAKFGKSSERALANPDQVLTSKRQAFHYGIFAHNYAESPGSSGHAEINGNDFIISLGSFTGNTGTPAEQSRTFMHEFGHNLNLDHGGGDAIHCKPNYISIMNYAFQNDPFGIGNPIDYSRSGLPTLDENHLNEVNGLGQATPNTLKSVFAKNGISGAANRVVTGALSNPTNPQTWNGDSDTVDTDVAAAIRNMGAPCPAVSLSATPLVGYDDWSNTVLNFRGSGEFSDGVFTSFTALSETAGTAGFYGSGGHLDPFVNSITAPTIAFGKGVTQQFSATFVDPDGLQSDGSTPDTYTAIWDWGDGTTSAGGITITNPPDSTDNTQEGTISSSGHPFPLHGKYTVTVTVTQTGGNSDTSTFPVPMMVFDTATKNQNVATASQISPAGALTSDPTFQGTASFSFQAQYTKGKPVGSLKWDLKRPDGSTLLSLVSTQYEWVISDGKQNDEGYMKGKATLTGYSSPVNYVVHLVDGNVNGGTGPDKERIRIYVPGGSPFNNNDIIYDNEVLDRSSTPAIAGANVYDRATLLTSTGTIAVKFG